MDLTNWKLTLPTGEEVFDLTKDYPNYFMRKTSESMTFRCPVNGKTTPNSKYPRCELREMKDGKEASWSTFNNKSLIVEAAITHLPKKKPHVVVAQIHDQEDDVVMVRLEDKKLFLELDGKDGPVLTDNYQLGDRFKIEFRIGLGGYDVLYNDSVVPYSEYPEVYKKELSGLYFKAGCYVQSNCDKEDDCSEDNYGEVIIYNLELDKIEGTPGIPEEPPIDYEPDGDNTRKVIKALSAVIGMEYPEDIDSEELSTLLDGVWKLEEDRKELAKALNELKACQSEDDEAWTAKVNELKERIFLLEKENESLRNKEACKGELLLKGITDKIKEWWNKLSK